MPAGPLASETVHASLCGDQSARSQLLEAIYDDLRAIAARRMAGERGNHTLQPTAVVNEALARLIGQVPLDLQDRDHFLALAAMTMRRVLVDHARRKNAQRRGGGRSDVDVEQLAEVDWNDPAEILSLHEALEEFARTHERQAKVVELRFFGGLGLEDTARALDVSRDTVKLDWRFARAWLNRRLAGGGRD